MTASSRPIALLGFMGCGKTTVGKILAKKLGWNFQDLDAVISDKEGIPIPEIFSRFGEEYFRMRESEALQYLACHTRTVLSTGGGLPAQEENWKILDEFYLTVYLKCHFDILYQRIRSDRNRPLTLMYAGKDKLFELYRKRMPYYERARVTIDTMKGTPQHIAEEIITRAHLAGSTQGKNIPGCH